MVKILVYGDVHGNLEALFTKVGKQNAKAGPFDMLICVGDFLGDGTGVQKWLQGEAKAPIPTYVCTTLSPDGEAGGGAGSVAPDTAKVLLEALGTRDVLYLGERGVSQLSGLTIAHLAIADHSKMSEVLRMARGDSMTSTFPGVDILLTPNWPQNILYLVPKEQRPSERIHPRAYGGSKVYAKLAFELKPRYHFSGAGGAYFARPAYRNGGDDSGVRSSSGSLIGFVGYEAGKAAGTKTPGTHVTRFIGLGALGTPAKHVFAGALDPLDQMAAAALFAVPDDATPCPYADLDYRGAEGAHKRSSSVNTLRFSAGRGGARKRQRRDGERGGFRPKPQPIGEDQCWFCVRSPLCKKHLIVGIGDESYLTFPRGGITSDHVLIVPIEHLHNFAALEDDARVEIVRVKDAVKKTFAAQGCKAVFVYRNIERSSKHHIFIDAIPVPEDRAENVREHFEREAGRLGHKFEERSSDQTNDSYLRVELPNGTDIVLFPHGKRLDINFPRDVMCDVLGCGERRNWKNCALDEEGEAALTEQFRKQFSAFDPYAEDDDE